MAKYNDSWGIEVGADAVKAVRLVRSGNNVSVADWDILPFAKILTTPDLNVDEAVQVNLDAFLAKHDLAKSNMVVSVPGHMAFARFAKLPPVEPKKIPDIVRFEAVQQIPFPIEQVEWDYQVFAQEDTPDVEVGIFAITKERVMSYLSNFRRVNMRVDALTLSPLAVYNQYAYETAEDEDVPGTILLDIGSQSTDVIFVEDNRIWVRPVPIGGNSFTEALVKSFKLSFPKAEKLKREARTSKYARQIFQAMRPVFADLVQEVQRTIGYYQSINRDSDLKRVIGYGSTFRLPGLQKFLKQQLQMEVIRPDGFKRISVEGSRGGEFAENALNLATAYGLALQGLGEDAVSCNIMPQAIIKQRLWRAKQPWFAAAAAVLALAAGVSVGRVFMDRSSFAAANNQYSPDVQRVLQQANAYSTEFNGLKKDNPQQAISNIDRLLDYKWLWPKIIEDINLAIQATDPEPQTLVADYSKRDFANRSTMRRIFVDTVEVQYLPGGIPAAAAGARPGMPAQPVRPNPADASKWSQKTTAADFFTEEKAPVFQVTVKGTTPNLNAARLLSDHVVKWLRDNRSRGTRPYTFAGVDETSVLLVGSGTAQRGQFQPNQYNDPYGGTGMPDYDPSYEDPSMYGDPYGGAGNPYGSPRPAAINPGDIARLIPPRPGAQANRAGDSQFTLQWYIRLLPPEQARQAEAGRAVVPGPDVPEEQDGQDQQPQTPEQQQAIQPEAILPDQEARS